MPRRYKRRYRKRSRLSTRNIYMRTSAKSQALQIKALNSKVNAIAKRDRPEIKVLDSGVSEFSFSNELITKTYNTYPQNLPQIGTLDSQRVGNTIRVLNATFHWKVAYSHEIRQDIPNAEEFDGAQIRFIYLQLKSAYVPNSDIPAETLLDPGNILSTYAQAGPVYNGNVIAPFKNGITEYFRVLKDVKYTLYKDRPQKLITHKIVPKYKNQMIASDTSYMFKNKIYCLVVTSGLQWDRSRETLKVTYQQRLAYTDA
nr:capsid protein [Tundra vole stool-associated circular virus]